MERKRDSLRRNGVHDIKAWAFCGSKIIEGMDEENFGVKPSDLILVFLLMTKEKSRCYNFHYSTLCISFYFCVSFKI